MNLNIHLIIHQVYFSWILNSYIDLRTIRLKRLRKEKEKNSLIKWNQIEHISMQNRKKKQMVRNKVQVYYTKFPTQSWFFDCVSEKEEKSWMKCSKMKKEIKSTSRARSQNVNKILYRLFLFFSFLLNFFPIFMLCAYILFSAM